MREETPNIISLCLNTTSVAVKSLQSDRLNIHEQSKEMLRAKIRQLFQNELNLDFSLKYVDLIIAGSQNGN